jgi:hypothetical protein
MLRAASCHQAGPPPPRTQATFGGSNVQLDSAQLTALVRKMAARKRATVIPSIRSPGQTQRIPRGRATNRLGQTRRQAQRPSHCFEERAELDDRRDFHEDERNGC